MAFDASVHAKAIDLTKLSIEMTTAAGSGHPTSAASLSHIVTVLFYNHLRHDPAQPAHPASDRLVLSEGHAVPIVYAACADLGISAIYDGQLRPTTREDVMQLRAIASPVDGHPHPIFGFTLFDAATGSLGQGLSVAAGLACAARVDGLNKRIFCIIGDGESREGQVWEAVDFIADHKLAAVCPIFNCNVYAQSDKVSPLQSPEHTAKKLEIAGYIVKVIDGHNPSEIMAALKAHADNQQGDGRPFAIVAKTVKGWGAPSMQGQGHHGTPIKKDKLAATFAELDKTAQGLNAIWISDDLKIPALPQTASPKPQAAVLPSFTEALAQFGKSDVLTKGVWATRRAYGIALRALGHANPNITVLDADVKNSTFAEDFFKDPALAARYFECRIAEQNMVSVAAGLGAKTAGKIPFCSTFAKFFTRAYDQIEMAVNSGANLKMVGSHAGVSLAADGPSQMSLPDIAWFRSFTNVKRPDGTPAMYLLQPADAFAAYSLALKMAEYDGPCYMRTLRPETEFLYDDKTPFTLGGHELLTEGEDLLLIASGYMVHEANKALDKLDAAGIDAALVDLYSLPFDKEAILDLAQQCNGMVMTLEDNYGGGFGGAIADILAEDGGHFTLKQMYVNRMPKSGREPDDVMKYLGLSADDIVREATKFMELASA
ncbi:MAG: transketolase [Phycisphaeraceae bacterium]